MRVLVTGATGYVGSRLVPALVEAGHQVVVGVRDESRVADYAWSDDVESVLFDVEDTVSVHLAVRGMDAVVYLVHSMARGAFVTKDREAAEYVSDACDYAGVGRIVYLSGLVPPGELSDHLRSRLEVEQVFLDSPVPATVLRASMVIGAGSLSFELMRRMSERVPVTPIPSWMRRSLQPVSITDVVHVLATCLEVEPTDRHYDVGGDEVVTYQELLDLYAEIAGLWRPQVVVPLVPGRLVGEVVALISEIPRGTVTALIESLSHDMVCSEDAVRRDLVPGHEFMTLRESLERSLAGDTAATSPGADLQGEADSDPAWVGGSVRSSPEGVVRREPRSLLAGLLLGLPRPQAG